MATKRTKVIAVVAATICIMLFVAICFSPRTVYSWDREYPLSELENGVYGWYYRTSSPIFPSVIRDSIVVNIHGRIQSYDGEIQVVYRDGTPRIQIIDYYSGNRLDKIKVYIPEGSLRMGTENKKGESI